MGPPIQLFLTTIVMQPVLRQRQEYLLRILQAKKIPFTSYDVASDEKAKSLWRRKAPPGKQDLPGILVGGVFPGTFTDFEEAVEYNELDQFLKLHDPYDPDLDMRPPLPQQAIAVPGVALPSETSGIKVAPVPTPSPQPTKEQGSKASKDDFAGLDLEGVEATEDEISQLMDSLGLSSESNIEETAAPAPVSAGHLAGEAARIAKEKAEARKASWTGEGNAIKPLNLRKAEPATRSIGLSDAGSTPQPSGSSIDETLVEKPAGGRNSSSTEAPPKAIHPATALSSVTDDDSVISETRDTGPSVAE